VSEEAPNQAQHAPPTAPCCTPGRCAYFLDLDGTLVEIAQHPRAVRIDPDLRALIAELHSASAGALALISGRPIDDIDRLFEPTRLPAAGQHGAERRDAAGRSHVHAVDSRALDQLRAAARHWCDDHPGMMIEDKGLSLALHFRQAPEMMQPIALRVRERLQDMADEFHVLPGKMVLEIKPSGRDKGRAIREFLAETPFSERIPVFIGDDVTDEYGFAAVNALGGISIKVGSGPSVARWRLADVTAVRRWLQAAASARNEDAHEQS